MKHISLPTTRQAQIARKRLIEKAQEYLRDKNNFGSLLTNFFCYVKDNPALESALEEQAYNLLNNFEG